MVFFWDVVALAFQALTFFYIGKIVDPDALPEFGGAQVSYLEFVVVGIAVSGFVALALVRAASAFRQEQLTGTLEMLFMTPTTQTTIQLGLVFYDLIYMPLRTAVFFLIIVVAFDVQLDSTGILPATVTLLAFIPFVWGFGIVLSAATITFKKGGTALLASLLTLTSGAFFPITLFPTWLMTLAELNPMTIAITTMRETLLGGAGWSAVGDALVVLVPAAALTLLLGVACFRSAVRRERRRGTVGLY